jgi:hypothetical protein
MIEQLISVGSTGVLPFVPPAVVAGKPFQGWVSSDDLIDGPALASLLNLTSGTPINDKAGWLKYIDAGKTFYIARKPLRYGTTVAALKAASLLTGKQVLIGGLGYKVRLMSGMSIDPFSSILNNNGGGEWDQYLWPIFSAPDRPSADVWSYYTAGDLGLLTAPNLIGQRGVISVCKNQHTSITTALSARGWDYSAGTSLNPIARHTIINDANASEGNGQGTLDVYGFRPVLEFIGELPPEDLFYGEVAEADFITVAALTSLVGMGSIGSVTNANTTWLKYRYKGKTVYMPKKALRHGMTWEAMNNLGITKGTTQFQINGKAHTLRLPTGAASEPAGYGTIATGGSFNDLIYPVYGGVSLNQPEVQAYPRWAAYTDAELGLSTSKATSAGAGVMTWCQEIITGNSAHLVRGYNDADNAGNRQLLAGWYVALNGTQTYAGWRPIIEEV